MRKTSLTYMYDINNIVSSMFGIEMTLVFSKLTHKKEIQLRKNKIPCSSFTGNHNLSEKASLQNSFSKQHYYSYFLTYSTNSFFVTTVWS